MNSNQQSGVTLLELMLCIAILLISFSMATHGISNWLHHSRIITAYNNVNTALQYAKMYAISESVTTTVCPALDTYRCDAFDWQAPLIVFLDDNYNGIRDGEETLLRYIDATHPSIKVVSSRKLVRFHRGGINATPATVHFCSPAGDNQITRGMTISMQGRIWQSRDADRNGINEKRDGSNIDCN